MARVPKKFKAQLITTDVNSGDSIKRNFNNVRADISDQELHDLSGAIQGVLINEKLKSVGLTANSSLDLA